MMEELEVRIIKLEPMRVASVYGFGTQPEHQAMGKLLAYAGPKGYLDDLENHRIFGFNNPNPSQRSPNYGYEFWVQVGPDAEPEGEVRILGFEGGLYAVTRCEVLDQDPGEVIPVTWKNLVTWQEESKYEHGSHQWMEEHFPVGGSFDQFTLDLYMPISE
jgi:DNA gyrase inhibitor GyrI